MKPVILASKSPRRRKLIREAGIPFITAVSRADETTTLKRPSAIVTALAFRKAKEIAVKYPEHRVIGADTLVVCKGEIIGKPKNKNDALRMLRRQNGAWQSVYTGIAVVYGVKEFSGYALSRCKARKLSERELRGLAGKHMDKAGAYAVQDSSDIFIERIVGRFDNVVGFPMNLVRKLLRKTGYKVEKLKS